jgi:hypothetical protein
MKTIITEQMLKNAALTAVLGSLLITSSAFAADQGHAGQMHKGMRPGVFGTVSAVNGTTLTVTSKTPQGTTTTTYTIDTTNATVEKNNTTSTLGSVTVSNIIMVQGTINDTSITATNIHDGKPPMIGAGMKGKDGQGKNGQKGAPGMMKPAVMGNVTAVNGSIITVAGKDGTTYTVDATNATIKKAGGAGTLADITVGTMLVAQGTVNGTTVTATMIGTDMPHQMDKQGDAQHKSEKNMKGKGSPKNTQGKGMQRGTHTERAMHKGAQTGTTQN